MTGPKLIPIIGYVVVSGNYDEDGLKVYGELVREDQATARLDCDEARSRGYADADVYMLVPPDSFSRVSDA